MSADSIHQTQPCPFVDDTSPVITVCVRASALLYLGVEAFLSGTRFIVSKDAFDDASALSALPGATPVLFIVDGSNCSDGGVDLVRDLKAQCPTGRVVVLADQFEFGAMIAAKQAGADGFCLTETDRSVLIRSLDLVMLGEIVIPSAIILSMMGEAPPDGCQVATGVTQPTNIDPNSHRLSSRETEVLRCLKEGAPNKVIARKLNLAEATVKVHIKAILRKIGVGNRTQAAIWAADHIPFPGVLR